MKDEKARREERKDAYCLLRKFFVQCSVSFLPARLSSSPLKIDPPHALALPAGGQHNEAGREKFLSSFFPPIPPSPFETACREERREGGRGLFGFSPLFPHETPSSSPRELEAVKGGEERKDCQNFLPPMTLPRPTHIPSSYFFPPHQLRTPSTLTAATSSRAKAAAAAAAAAEVPFTINLLV